MPQSIRVSVAVKTVAFALLVGALAVTPLITVNAQKSRVRTAIVTIDDAPANGVTSDALTSGTVNYEHGIGGLSVAFASSSGDLVIQPNTSGRFYNVRLGATTYQARANFFIGGIGNLPISQTPKLAVARINFGSGLPNHVLLFRDESNQGLDLPGATFVCATRSSQTNWRVETAVATLSGPQCSGWAAPAGAGATGGLITEVSKKGSLTQTFVGIHVVPFALDVVCKDNCQ